MSAMRERIRRAKDERGFTLIEVTIILLVLVILSTIMLPQLGNFNRLARFVKVTEDLVVLCSAMKKMLDEVMDNAFWGDPQTKSIPIGLLFTDGRIPRVNQAVVLIDPTADNWGQPLNLGVGDDLDPQPISDFPMQIVNANPFVADDFMNHFLMNDPLGGGGEHYDDPLDVTQEWLAFGWHGPYFNKLLPDPWGNRYQSNVFALHADPVGNVYTSAVVVLSAGPNGVVDTPFDMYYKSVGGMKYGGQTPESGPGYALGVDDQACVLSAGGPF